IEPALLKTTLDDLSIAIGDAVDGGKKALHERDRPREDVIRMLRILAHYVEATCNDDMAAFLSSGFLPQTSTRVAPQPLAPTSIRRIDQGSSGQLLIKVVGVSKAWSYELRYAPSGSSGTGPWTSQPITAVLSPTPCNGLTPGTTYLFQVRALGRL